VADNRQQNKSSKWQGPFFTIWTGQQLSLIGSMLAGFALVWWLTERTGSATVLATASLVQMLPRIVLGPFAGALVDRWNRRKVMIVADTVIAVVSAWLAYLFWTDALQIWHVYVIMAVRSIGGTFHWPAMSASTSLMVPDEHLARVSGINQTMHGILQIVSPPLGALLVSVMPVYSIMAIDVVSAAFAIVPLFFVHIPQPERRAAAVDAGTAATAKSKPSLLDDMREGFQYVWSWPGLRSLLIMATVLNFLLNPAGSLMPLLITKHFGGGAAQLGLTNSLWGVGVVLGGLLLSVWGGFKRRIVTSMAGVIGLGVGALLIGFAPSSAFWLAIAGMFLLGLTNPLANGPINAIFQSVIAPDMQGRAFTLIGSACGAMSPIGMAIAGPVADALGVQSWYVVGGVACVLMSTLAFMSPTVMNIESNHGQPEAKEEPVPLSADVPAGAD
jgi:DHA3 family macrolide efflux protein-like MFS transporter